MKKVTLLFAAMLILQTQISAQVTEGYLPNNLGRIVEIATPNGVLAKYHNLIGWDSNGMTRNSSAQDSFRIFGVLPHLSYLNLAENSGAINRYNLFGAPSAHHGIEIRFGDSSYYWISPTISGGRLAREKAPFSFYLTEPRSAGNPSVTGGQKICFKVFDSNYDSLYTPGERIYVYGDLAYPLDSLYDHIGSLPDNPFTNNSTYLYGIRFGKTSVPYTQTSFNMETDGTTPPPGTVIRFIAQTADTSAPFAVIADIEQDTGTFTYPVLHYSYARPLFELLRAPARMTVDTNGIITWTPYTHQTGNVYEGKMKLTNGAGELIVDFTAAIKGQIPAVSGYAEYRTEINGNKIRFWQRNDGSIGYRSSQGNFGMEYPSGTNYSLIYAGGLYIGGKKRGTGTDPDTVSVSNHEFAGEFQPGRILNSGPFAGLTGEDFNVYQSFFSLPENRNNWPDDAPRNEMGWPMRLSGKDTWTVFNDIDLSRHKPDNINPAIYNPGLGIEVQRQTFQFAHYPFNHAVIVRYRIINKSDRPYDSCYVGFWNDPDVGGEASQDITQSDSARSLVITYSDTGDPANTAAGIQILQGPAEAGTAGDTAEIITADVNGITKMIKNNKKIHRAISALSIQKPSGSPVRVEGDVTRYHYLKGLDVYGNPKPFGPFDVTVSGRSAQDQRSFISSGPFDFAPGDTQEVWMAYIGGQGVDNASAVDTVRHYAEWILNDFKNNQIYKFDQTAPSFSIYGLSTQAVNRIRFVVNANEPLVSATLSTSGAALTLQPSKNGYYADYDIHRTGNISLTMTGKDLAGNIGSMNKTYQVSSLNKSATYGKYTFHPGGEGYLLTSKTDAKNIPEKCFLIGEPMEWIATQNSGQMKVEFAFTNSDLIKVQNRYDEFDVMNLGLYSWNGEKWEPVETAVTSNKLSGMAKGSVMAVFYNPEGNSAPQRFALEANYPNPFNPSTVIRYQLAVSGKVSLKIYNLLGQEVRTLVNTQQSSGIHTAVWDGKNNHGQRVSSGVYLYRLEAGDFVITRKMVLVK